MIRVCLGVRLYLSNSFVLATIAFRIIVGGNIAAENSINRLFSVMSLKISHFVSIVSIYV